MSQDPIDIEVDLKAFYQFLLDNYEQNETSCPSCQAALARFRFLFPSIATPWRNP